MASAEVAKGKNDPIIIHNVPEMCYQNVSVLEMLAQILCEFNHAALSNSNVIWNANSGIFNCNYSHTNTVYKTFLLSKFWENVAGYKYFQLFDISGLE